MWRSVRKWQGIVLVVATLVSTVWLALTNQLILYIHPRYVVFTVIMAVLGLVFVVASFANKPDHDHDEPPKRWGAVVSGAATVLTLVVAVGLVVVPPATLTVATADQRGINSTGVGIGAQNVSTAASAPTGTYAKFTVLDWSSLLRQTTDPSFYQNKTADVTGFISPDQTDPGNLFYVTRFVITCCAVDAQPVGVPVYLSNWKTDFSANEWVRVEGDFDTNPSRTSQESIALVPTDTTKVAQPSDPYLY